MKKGGGGGRVRGDRERKVASREGWRGSIDEWRRWWRRAGRRDRRMILVVVIVDCKSFRDMRR